MTEEQKPSTLSNLTELEKIERLGNMSEVLYQVSTDLSEISAKGSYDNHRKILLEVAYSLMISVKNRAEDHAKMELERRKEADQTDWEQDQDLRDMVEDLRG